jgi:hypothetical protein
VLDLVRVHRRAVARRLEDGRRTQQAVFRRLVERHERRRVPLEGDVEPTSISAPAGISVLTWASSHSLSVIAEMTERVGRLHLSASSRPDPSSGRRNPPPASSVMLQSGFAAFTAAMSEQASSESTIHSCRTSPGTLGAQMSPRPARAWSRAGGSRRGCSRTAFRARRPSKSSGSGRRACAACPSRGIEAQVVVAVELVDDRERERDHPIPRLRLGREHLDADPAVASERISL